MRVQLDTSGFFFSDVLWATVVNIQEEQAPIRHCCSFSVELISFLSSPLLCLSFILVSIWLWTAPLSLYSLTSGCRPLFFVCVISLCEICVCVYVVRVHPLQPHRGWYTSLALSACHCYASFVPLSSCECVLMPMNVYMCLTRACVSVYEHVYRMCASILYVCMCLLCVWVCVQLLPAKTQLLSVSVHCV